MILTRPADVVHDLILSILKDRSPDASADVIEGVIPRDLLPLAAAARALALQGLQDALCVTHLIDRGGPLRASPAARARVNRVPFELLDLAGLLVHEGQEAAG